MWSRTGRSSALDKAQALLSEKKHNKDANVSKERSRDNGHTDPGESFKRRTVPPSKHTLLQELSDLSSVSLVSEHEDSTVGSAAAGKNQEKDQRPQTSLGGGSRFLKKARPPSARKSQSPEVSRTKIHQPPEPRYVSSSQRSSQSTALSRLALIEERIRNRKQSPPDAQVQGTEVAKSAEIAGSDLGLSPQQSASPPQASNDLSPRGKRFLKKTAAVAAADGIPAAIVPKNLSVSVKTTVATPLAISRAQPIRVLCGVSLDSDEEEMKKLLGDSIEDPPLRPGRTSLMKTAGKRASPPQRGSPSGSPSLARSHPSPPASPSPLARTGSPLRVRSPPRAPSSSSGRSEVLSLEDLFPAFPGSERSLSERSGVSSEDFKINVMTLDDLAIATLDLTESERRPSHRKAQSPSSLTVDQEEAEVGEGEVADYQSDFESESRTQPDNTASEISDILGVEVDLSEIREEVSDWERSRGGSGGEDSAASRSHATRTSSRSEASASRRPRPRSSRSLLCSSDTVTPSRLVKSKAMREAAVQTVPDALAYTWSAGVATMGPALGMAYVDPTPVASHTISAEAVEALSAYSPAMFALNDMLRQQLAMTKQFIQASRHLHSSLVQSLGPADYSYTTLEDTKRFIRKNKPPKLTVEQALEEVLQEMRDYHYI